MRYNNFSFKFHTYNFNYIAHHYGSQGVLLLKSWIDTNYRVINTYSKLQFLKQCKQENVFPQHISNYTHASYQVFHHKAIRKLKGLTHKFKFELLKIEIFDLYKYIHFLNNELYSLYRDLSLLLPIFVWDLIKKHHFNLFNRAKHRSFLSHYKKFNRLLTVSRIESTKNIKKINYTYFFTNKKFALTINRILKLLHN